MKITKNSTIGEVVDSNPLLGEIMMNRGLHCVGCHVKYHETIEQGCKAHGMDDEEIADMLKELNEVPESKEVSITESAAKKLIENQDKGSVGVRLEVIPGGCAGYTYDLDYTNTITKSDEVFESHGIKVIVDKQSLKFVKGAIISYSKEDDGF